MWRAVKPDVVKLEERRLEAARLLRAGDLSQAEVARRLGVSRTAVNRWAGQLLGDPQGLATLKSRPRPGRTPRLAPEQWRELLDVLKQGATHSGFGTDRWSLARIRVVIERRWGVSYRTDYLSARLRELEWSPRRPQTPPPRGGRS